MYRSLAVCLLFGTLAAHAGPSWVRIADWTDNDQGYITHVIWDIDSTSVTNVGTSEKSVLLRQWMNQPPAVPQLRIIASTEHVVFDCAGMSYVILDGVTYTDEGPEDITRSAPIVASPGNGNATRLLAAVCAYLR